MSIRTAKIKITICQIITFLCVALLACPLFADVNSEIRFAEKISTLPAQVLLALVAMGCLAFAYHTWKKFLEFQERTLKSLENRPCLMSHEEITEKYCKK